MKKKKTTTSVICSLMLSVTSLSLSAENIQLNELFNRLSKHEDSQYEYIYLGVKNIYIDDKFNFDVNSTIARVASLTNYKLEVVKSKELSTSNKIVYFVYTLKNNKSTSPPPTTMPIPPPYNNIVVAKDINSTARKKVSVKTRIINALKSVKILIYHIKDERFDKDIFNEDVTYMIEDILIARE